MNKSTLVGRSVCARDSECFCVCVCTYTYVWGGGSSAGGGGVRENGSRYTERRVEWDCCLIECPCACSDSV